MGIKIVGGTGLMLEARVCVLYNYIIVYRLWLHIYYSYSSCRLSRIHNL